MIISSSLAAVWPFLNFEDHWNFVQPNTLSPNAVLNTACTSNSVLMRLILNLTCTHCFLM
jgi:hypothetical protein